ncbi:MAG: hypothetical protein RIQ37_72 [Actinomycetota bacterium]
MASLSAAAIVVSHARPDLLEKSLRALSLQEVAPKEVVVVETSQDLQSKTLCEQFGFKFLPIPALDLNSAISNGIETLSVSVEWLWILHDDCEPEPDCLAQLLRTAETSPSVAVVGPKLLETENPLLIQQLGLTVTSSGRPFVLVQEEYDQGQHDRVDDVMATSTAGMLVSLGVWQNLGGLNAEAPTLAQDLDFGLRVRTAGYRVIVEPRARCLHAGLSLKGQRDKRWLGGSWATAIAKSENYLATLLLPIWAVPLRILLLPIFALIYIPLHLYRKKPARIWGDFLSWIWTWALLPRIIRGRNRLRSLGNPGILKALYATATQTRRRRESKLEFVAATSESKPGFFASGAAWASVIPLLANFRWYPSGESLGVSQLAPPSFKDWVAVVSSQLVPGVNGANQPMDPFTWLLGIFPILNPSSPSAALAMFVFLAPTLAYFSAWKLLGQTTSSRLLTTFFALGYSFLAAVSIELAGVHLAMLSVALPLAIWSLLKMFYAETNSRAWRWTGVASLLLSFVAVTSPALLLLIVFFALTFAASRRHRLVSFLASVVPSAILLLPYLLSAPSPLLWLFGFEQALETSDEIFVTGFLLFASPLILLASFAILKLKFGQALFTTAFALFTFVAGFLLQGDATRLIFWLATAIALLHLSVSVLDSLNRKWLGILLGLPVIIWVASLSGIHLFSQNVEFGPARNVPALVEAAAATGEEVRTLRVQIQSEYIEGSLVLGDGEQLHESSLVGTTRSALDLGYQELLSEIAARLSAGNPTGLKQLLIDAKLDFVLLALTDSGAEVAAASNLTTMPFIQSAGETEFGYLFRVNESDPAQAPILPTSDWFVWQVGLIVLFGLLAIPTPAAILGTRRKSESTAGDET